MLHIRTLHVFTGTLRRYGHAVRQNPCLNLCLNPCLNPCLDPKRGTRGLLAAAHPRGSPHHAARPAPRRNLKPDQHAPLAHACTHHSRTRARTRPPRRSPTARARARRRNYAAHAHAPRARAGACAPSEPVTTPVHTPTLQNATHPQHSPPFPHVLAEITSMRC